MAADGIVVSDPTTITGELVTLLDPQPFLFLVPIGAVLAFALSFGQRSKRRSYLKVAGGIAGLLAISITFVGIMNRALEAQQSGSLARYETRLAFWGTVGGLVLIVLFARSEAANQPPPYSPLESDTHELDVDNAT